MKGKEDFFLSFLVVCPPLHAQEDPGTQHISQRYSTKIGVRMNKAKSVVCAGVAFALLLMTGNFTPASAQMIDPHELYQRVREIAASFGIQARMPRVDEPHTAGEYEWKARGWDLDKLHELQKSQRREAQAKMLDQGSSLVQSIIFTGKLLGESTDGLPVPLGYGTQYPGFVTHGWFGEDGRAWPDTWCATAYRCVDTDGSWKIGPYTASGEEIKGGWHMFLMGGPPWKYQSLWRKVKAEGFTSTDLGETILGLQPIVVVVEEVTDIPSEGGKAIFKLKILRVDKQTNALPFKVDTDFFTPGSAAAYTRFSVVSEGIAVEPTTFHAVEIDVKGSSPDGLDYCASFKVGPQDDPYAEWSSIFACALKKPANN
jgi:hypothetical protein